MSHTPHQHVVRWPLNFTHASVTLRGVTPEGITIEIEAGKIMFADPDGAALVEVLDTSRPDPSPLTTDPGRTFMLDVRGTLFPLTPGGELFQVKTEEREDVERLVTQPPAEDVSFPTGWCGPETS